MLPGSQAAIVEKKTIQSDHSFGEIAIAQNTFKMPQSIHTSIYYTEIKSAQFEFCISLALGVKLPAWPHMNF